MKLLVVLSRVPYPLDKGDKLRAFHQIKCLARKHEVILCCTADAPVHPEAVKVLSEFCQEIHIYPLGKAGILWRMLLALFSRLPFQVCYFNSYHASRGIKSVIERHRPDRIFAQLIRTTEFVKHIHHIPKTMDYMDAFSKGFERRKTNSNGLKRWFFAEEAGRLVAYEHLIFDYFDKHCIISEQDKQLIYHPDRNRIEVVPNGVDFEFFSPSGGDKDIDVLFTGNMNYAPNEQAAERLAKSIMPLVWAQRPDAKLMIAGADPTRKVLNLADTRVIVTGRIPDIREAYSRSRVFAAPMQMGTGLQNKLLEAMAMELPCITTSVANNALGATPDRQVLIARTDEDCANHILHLLNDETINRELATAGRAFVHSLYSWSAQTVKLEKLIEGN
jgi:polysaccharide biosynthesis protein PslH